MAAMPDEPTIADVLAAVTALGTRTDQAFANLTVRLDRIETRGNQTYAEVMAVKADLAFVDQHIGDLQEAVRRHLADPNPHGRAAA
jgi:hypothetical protein